MKISKPKMREKASSLWLLRNPSIWNDYQMGTPTTVLAFRYNLATKTIENIVRAFKSCPENPRRWFWEQSQGWKWKPKSLATIRRENRLKFQHRPAPEITKEQHQRTETGERRLRPQQHWRDQLKQLEDDTGHSLSEIANRANVSKSTLYNLAGSDTDKRIRRSTERKLISAWPSLSYSERDPAPVKGTATYMTFTHEGKEHTVEATTFGAILDLWNQDGSIAITKVKVR